MSEAMFLIWSNQHRAWWRPNSRGYTTFAKAAGIYTFEQARGMSWQGRAGWAEDGLVPDELAVPLDAIPEAFRPAMPENGAEQPNATSKRDK